MRPALTSLESLVLILFNNIKVFMMNKMYDVNNNLLNNRTQYCPDSDVLFHHMYVIIRTLYCIWLQYILYNMFQF